MPTPYPPGARCGPPDQAAVANVVSVADAVLGRGPARISMGVPAGSISASWVTTSLVMRMQPFDAAVPMRSGWLVPWKATTGRPLSNRSSASL